MKWGECNKFKIPKQYLVKEWFILTKGPISSG